MSYKGKSTLKGYFVAGSVPTATNFEDLVDSTHNGQGTYQLVSDNTDTTIDSTETAGGIIHILGSGTTSDEQLIKLPEASSGNIGLTYKVILGKNATNLRIGPDGTTTKLSGSLTVHSPTGSIWEAAPLGATHVSLSSADAAKGGVSGSCIEFFYNSATGVTVFGKVLNSHATSTGATLYGTGDIG